MVGDMAWIQPDSPHGWSWSDEDCENSVDVTNEAGQLIYRRGNMIGTGSYSKVYKVLRLYDGRILAGKSTRALVTAQGEANNLLKVTHNHILKFEDWYRDPTGCPEKTLLLTEYCGGGDLRTYLQKIEPRGMRGQDIMSVTEQMASALEYLHKEGYFHGDFKPHNIALRSYCPMDAVLIDFADVQDSNDSDKYGGTRTFWSPGMWKDWSPGLVTQKRPDGCSDDMWALGLTVLGMIGQLPECDGDSATWELLDEYPRTCHVHGNDLQMLNPNNGILKMTCKLLA